MAANFVRGRASRFFRDEDIIEALGNGVGSDIECFDDSDNEECFFSLDYLNKLHLQEDPAEDQKTCSTTRRSCTTKFISRAVISNKTTIISSTASELFRFQLQPERGTEQAELAMGVPYITQFCCCMGLEVGAKAVGYLHLVVSVCLTILCAIFTSEANDTKGTGEDLGDNLYSKVYVYGLVVTVVSVVHILLACMLLLGAYKRITVLLRVWVLVMCTLFLAAIIFIIVAAAIGFSASGSDIFICFAEGLLFFAVVAYCILCVNSYYLKLKSSEDMEGPGKTDY